MEEVIEFIEYNFLLSLFDYFESKFKDKTVFGKTIDVMQSYPDKHLNYNSPSLTIEILRRKNSPLGFGDFLFEKYEENNVIEFTGASLEYRVQINVYSNTRGEIHKWSSLLDRALKEGESRYSDEGKLIHIPLNIYNDNGSIKQPNVGIIDYSYANDVKNNNLQPNVVTYDFHTIYEVKINVIQTYAAYYDYSKIGNINGKLKTRHNEDN